jgi:hypothetical protein
MELIVHIKSVYGTDKVYPINEAAKIFAKIANTTTLTADTLILAKKLGYKIIVRQPEFAL